jgi:hypothetical protein
MVVRILGFGRSNLAFIHRESILFLVFIGFPVFIEVELTSNDQAGTVPLQDIDSQFPC